MISTLLPGTAFAAQGEGGHIKGSTIFGGATWNGGRGGSPGHGSGQGGHLTGEMFITDEGGEVKRLTDLNGGFGEGGSVVGDVHQGGGGGGCYTDPESGRECGKLPLDLA